MPMSHGSGDGGQLSELENSHSPPPPFQHALTSAPDKGRLQGSSANPSHTQTGHPCVPCPLSPFWLSASPPSPKHANPLGPTRLYHERDTGLGISRSEQEEMVIVLKELTI